MARDQHSLCSLLLQRSQVCKIGQKTLIWNYSLLLSKIWCLEQRKKIVEFPSILGFEKWIFAKSLWAEKRECLRNSPNNLWVSHFLPSRHFFTSIQSDLVQQMSKSIVSYCFLLWIEEFFKSYQLWSKKCDLQEYFQKKNQWWWQWFEHFPRGKANFLFLNQEMVNFPSIWGFAQTISETRLKT